MPGQVRYAFNEPVRALLLVNGKAGNRGLPRCGQSGALLWHAVEVVAALQIAIEGIDRSGRRAIVRL